jgi:hypothetical protein
VSNNEREYEMKTIKTVIIEMAEALSANTVFHTPFSFENRKNPVFTVAESDAVHRTRKALAAAEDIIYIGGEPVLMTTPPEPFSDITCSVKRMIHMLQTVQSRSTEDPIATLEIFSDGRLRRRFGIEQTVDSFTHADAFLAELSRSYDDCFPENQTKAPEAPRDAV